MWSDSHFGPQDQWEPTVQTVVRTLLEASAPMAYCHGTDYVMVYNDRFADLLGSGHPRAWGQPAAKVLPELWSRPGYAEAVDTVFSGGPTFHDDGERLDVGGQPGVRPSWASLARSYSAVRDSHGSVLGILIVVVEIAPLLGLVGEAEHSDLGAAGWPGIELWDETVAHRSLIWSGFRAGPTPRGGTTAGGAFYDVFDLPDGSVAVTIGEVKGGAGLAAEAVASQITVGLRDEAVNSSHPNPIYATLDELVSRLDQSLPDTGSDHEGSATAGDTGSGGELVVTALIGIFDPATGALIVASAGQQPPATVRRRTAAGGQAHAARLVEYAKLEPGPPLGVIGDRPVLRLVLEEGDALVALTDGVLGRNQRSLAEGQATVLRTLGAMSSTAPRSISQHMVAELIADGDLEHDCVLLVVVRDSRVHQMASVLVPPHPIAVRGARLWVHDQLESWDLDEEMVNATIMCVSELVTNAGQHAGTSARVTMELADRLLVTVEDTGRWSTPRARGEDHTAPDGRGLPLVAAFSDAMGHARGANGSTVWFEIALNYDST